MADVFFVTVDADEVVSDEPIRLHGVVLVASSGGTADATLYEGLDATTGRLIVTLKAAASTMRPWNTKGLLLRRGLFVDVGSNVTHVVALISSA